MDYRYDVFISFKNSSGEGITIDREVAQKIYDILIDNNLCCFFSNQTLKENGTANYMLEIQNAIESSKSMLIIFSNPEYIASGWVAQEWLTFLNIALCDPDRSVFTYSINKDISGLPPFLRPYECFVDYDAALSHIVKNINNRSDSKSTNTITTRDFYNSYWGLFGNYDIAGALKKFSNRDNLKNYDCYRAKHLHSYKKHIDDATELLIKCVDKKNRMAMYLLSMHYRRCESLDLKLSKGLVRNAFELFCNSLYDFSSDNAEINIVIWHNKNEYNGAFYLADVFHDVLSAYDVLHTFTLASPEHLPSCDFSSARHVVALLSSEDVEEDVAFTNILAGINKEKLLIGLNAFSDGVLPPELRSFFIFDNSDVSISKACRTLLST